MAGLGPKPRVGGGGGAADGLQFFTPPAGAVQPGGGFPQQPGMGGVQPPHMGGGFPQIQAGVAPGGYPAPPQGSLGGSIGGPSPPQQFGSFPQPQQLGNFPQASMQQTSTGFDDFENEPPLLEELGINVEHIALRIKGVAFFTRVDQAVLEDLDLSGPVAIVLSLGACLLCAGKISFQYVYGLGLTGCVVLWMLVNLMNQRGGIDLYRTASILGYGLIPIVFLAFLGIFVSLQSTTGTVAAALCIFWSTATSSRFFATAIAMQQQRWLVAYPVGLFYTCFTLITVF